MQTPPEVLVPVVAEMVRDGARVVTLGDLARWCGDEAAAGRAARVLREGGWLVPMRARGAWRSGVWQFRLTAGFEELEARLRTRPATPAVIAGRSVMEVRGWLKRPTEPTIGMPPGVVVPRCLSGFNLLRWQPKAPLDSVEGLPVWSPATLVAYMAARPARFSFEDVGEWLDLVCGAVGLDGLVCELEGRARSVWMKAAFIMWCGEQPDAASQLSALAPTGARGPYKFGVPTGRWGARTYADFDVVDYIFVRHFELPEAHFIRWDDPDGDMRLQPIAASAVPAGCSGTLTGDHTKPSTPEASTAATTPLAHSGA